jgi:hypothetical protein
MLSLRPNAASMLLGTIFVAVTLLASPSFADNGGGNASEIPLYHKHKARTAAPEAHKGSGAVPADRLTEDSDVNAAAGGGNADEIPAYTGSTKVHPAPRMGARMGSEDKVGADALTEDSDINADAGGGNANEIPGAADCQTASEPCK